MPSKNVQRSKSNTKKAVENNSQIVQNKHHKTKPPTGVIKAPKVCPSGKRVDSNGTCRAVY
ncbi:CLUMA_CG007299, isoform A [Clunio marinus]|uniref:CLUMA_CG007299, isoform A n=1 Tax=Clunio marinus TaxID=568069 RepID=A0A1J1I0P5_9DIPT|nr:CLUMA_CG007299, isoform A [Clunio marinus]